MYMCSVGLISKDRVLCVVRMNTAMAIQLERRHFPDGEKQ